MRTIDVTKIKTKCYSGSYSSYYRISKLRGVKIIDSECSAGEMNPEDLDSTQYGEAFWHYKSYKQFESSITPKVYEIVKVKTYNGYYYGIVMSHCKGKPLGEYNFSFDYQNELLEKAAYKFYTIHGIHMSDKHAWNVVYHKKTKKYKVIDFY